MTRGKPVTLKDRENKMYDIEKEIEDLFETEVDLDYRDVIIDMKSFLEEMIENPNNEYKPQKSEWEDLYMKLEELIISIEDADIQFIYKKYTNYKNYYSSLRKKIIQDIIKEFSLLNKRVNTISENIEDLINSCQIVSENSDKPGFVEEYKNIADDMILNLEDYKERLSPYKALVENLNELR